MNIFRLFLPTLAVVLAAQLVTQFAMAATVTKDLNFKDYKIKLSQTSKKDGSVDATVKVFSGDKDIATREFKGMRPSDGKASLFVAKSQPVPGLFFIGKEGDFDSLLVFVTEAGEIGDIPWGDVGKDDEYIIAVRTLKGQEPHYAVVDIEKQRVLYRVGNTEKKKYLKEGYSYKAFSKGKYYFLKGEPAISSDKDSEPAYLSISSKQKWLIDQTLRWGKDMDKGAEPMKPLYSGSFQDNFEALN